MYFIIGVRRAERANIPVVIVKHKEFSTREAFDDEMDKHLESHGVELICLAGFMRILSAKFVRKWHGNLINIHPSLLPLFKGIHAQKEALEAGVKLSGCTVHYVDVSIKVLFIHVISEFFFENNSDNEILLKLLNTVTLLSKKFIL